MVRNVLGAQDQQLGVAIGYGVVTAVLYGLLFFYDEEVLTLSSRGGWAAVLPAAIAFAISLTHGTFTAAFWDLFDIKAKK